MEEDERAREAELKCRINQFIWENAPGRITIARAENIAVAVFDAFQHAADSPEKAYSPPEEMG